VKGGAGVTEEPRVPEPAPAPDDLIQVSAQRQAPDTALVRVVGEVDMATGDLMAERLDEAMVTGVRVLMVDLTGVTFFGSTGLAVLLRARERARARHVDLRIVAGQRSVIRPMQVGGVAESFHIHASVPDALAADGR
jgi:anti-sigma B factor antagonist